MQIDTDTPSYALNSTGASQPWWGLLCGTVACAVAQGIGIVAVLCLLAGGLVPTAAGQQLNRVDENILRQARSDFHGDDMKGKDGPLAKVGLELALLYREHQRFEQSGAETFRPKSVPAPGSASASLKRGEASEVPNPSGYISPVRGETVVVDAIPRNSASDLAATMRELGAEKVATTANLVSATVPIDRLSDLATASSLRSARMAHATVKSTSVPDRMVEWLERKAAGKDVGPLPVPRSSTGRAAPASGAAPLPGATISQGDQAMNTDDVKSSLNIDGSGVKVGVLSDSYNTADAATTAKDDIQSNDLPPAYRIEILDELEGTGIDEGRAMMQLIYDVAPGADLAFHTAFGGRANFAQGIRDLANAGADVTVDDIGYFAEPFFQDGPIAQAVNDVSSQGVPHFASAGNSADQSVESDTWRAVMGDDGPAFDFGATIGSGTTDTTQTVTIGDASQFGTARFIFQWDDPAASADTDPGNTSTPSGADTDLDLLLYDSNGNLVASSTFDNIGSDPVEVLEFNSPSTEDYQLVVRKAGGPDPGLIKYTHNGAVALQEYDTNSSTSVGHNNAAGGAGVAAAFYQDTPEFGTSPPEPENFTSLGGTPIIFETDGTKRSNPGPRDQPRITAPDGTNNTFFGGDRDNDGLPNFSGTSAAAPHAAALAALQLQADASLSPTQVYNAQASGATDMGPSGFDFLTGAGLVNAQNTITQTTGAQDIELVTSTTVSYGDQFFDTDNGSLFDRAAATVEIVNTGNQDLTINNVAISGGAFRFQSGNAITTGTLAPSERVTATLLFDPSSTGSFSETLTIESDDPDASESTLTLNLSGDAILPPVADVSASSLFEAVETGNTATQTFSVSNTGDNPLEYDVFAEALGLGPFSPSDVAATPSSQTTNATPAPSLQALDAPKALSTKQAFNVSDFIYTLDDGSNETSIGFGGGSDDVLWLNSFQAKEGATTITAIASAFGGSQPVGSNVEFLLYDDPNDDGDPSDANLLRTVSTTTEVSGGGTLQIEPITPTQVEGVFFVAVLVPSAGDFPAPLDESSDQGASWIANSSSGSFDTSDLSANNQLFNISGTQTAGNWVLRAQGAYASFEPVSRTVAAGNSDDVDITFDGTSLATGRYQANAAVTSNDPETPKVDVPFTFFVADAVGEATLGTSNSSATFDDTGVEVNLSGVNGSGTVTAMRFDDPPTDVGGLASGEEISDYRWFLRDSGNVTFDSQSELRFNRADIPGPGFDETNAQSVTVYRRSSLGSGTFQSLSSSFDDGNTQGDLSDDAIVATGATDFSEFAFASDAAPLPVEMTQFEGRAVDTNGDDGTSGTVRLTWRTASETNNAGFEVQRRNGAAGSWQKVGFREGAGTTNQPQTYRFTDRQVPYATDSVSYRLRQVDTDGTATLSDRITVERGGLDRLQLLGTAPNPARQTTIVRYGVPKQIAAEAEQVRIRLFDVLGRRVRTVRTDGEAGRHKARLNVRNLASGVYVLRLTAGGQSVTRKLTVVR